MILFKAKTTKIGPLAAFEHMVMCSEVVTCGAQVALNKGSTSFS